jgi:hypothetical protein
MRKFGLADGALPAGVDVAGLLLMNHDEILIKKFR